MSPSPLQAFRYAAESERLASCLEHPEIGALAKEFGHEAASPAARKELLSSALRIDRAVLPDVHDSIERLRERAGLEEEVECYVHAAPLIQAAVFRLRGRYSILISSSAIEKLSPAELEFVVGHELGHVAYDHFSLPAGQILSDNAAVAPRHAMDLLSWQRAAEISADRAGLLACGSLEVAASAFFKTLSGLSLPGLRFDPLAFAAQFEGLREELWEIGPHELWAMSHPLPPLRMRALILFWESEGARALLPAAPGGLDGIACDREIGRLLAYMEPLAGRGADRHDPYLEPLLLWGGLYLATHDGRVCEAERAALRELVGNRRWAETLGAELTRSLDDRNHCRVRFREALASRSRTLTALEVHRLLSGLATIARSDGALDAGERESLAELASELGVTPEAINDIFPVDFFPPEAADSTVAGVESSGTAGRKGNAE